MIRSPIVLRSPIVVRSPVATPSANTAGSPVLVVARQVMVEAGRRRTLPVLVLFGCAVIISTAFLSFFQLGVEVKFFKDVAMTVLFLFGTVATLVLVSTQLSGEIESRTIYNVLSKPVRRWELVLGKYLGTVVAIALAIAPMVGILEFFIYTDHGGSMLEAAKAAYLLWLAFAVLSAVALALASFSGSIVCAALTVLVFVVSYLKSAVTTYLTLLAPGSVVTYLGQALYYLLPNFENFNTRTAVVHDEIVPLAYLGRTSLYAVALAALFLYVGVQIFEEREF
jgi:ABC-type transport system involved in multi-copper enzyme maturation permease subunit